MVPHPALKKAAAFVLAGHLGSLIVAIIDYPLTWGLMDDGQILKLLRVTWQHLSLWQVLRDYSTINGSYFRPLNTLYVYSVYGFFQQSPKLLYLFNFCFVVSALVPWALFLRRHLLSRYSSELMFIFCFLLLCATPLYNLIVYLSLQEKYIIFFGGWIYYGLQRMLERPRVSRLHWWIGQILLLAAVWVGFWGKATFIAYVPWLFLLLLFDQELQRGRKWGLLILLLPICLGNAFMLLHHKGSYNQKYRTDLPGLLERIHDLPMLFPVFILLGLLTLAVILFLRPKEKAISGNTRLFQLAWPISLISYLLVMLPWGINTYYWAPAMVSACGCLTLLIDSAFMQWPMCENSGMPAFLVMSMGLSSFAVFHVGVARLARQAEIKPMVDWLSAHLPNDRVKVYVQEPCMEATDNLEYYAGEKQKFKYLKSTRVPVSTRPIWWLITRDECMPDAKRAGLFEQVIYELPHWKIYQHTNS